LKVGEAIDVARVAAGVAAVVVLPSVIPLAVTDIAGTVGCAYMVVAGESPRSTCEVRRNLVGMCHVKDYRYQQRTPTQCGGERLDPGL
jgi:hypothetical protein